MHRPFQTVHGVTNLDSILNSGDITLLTKVCIVKAIVFPIVMYGCESWTTKKAEPRRTDAFELWCWRRLLRVPWTVRRSNQSILKEINPEYSSKYWCWSWSSNTLATWCEELTHRKRPWCWERLKAKEEGDRGWDRNHRLISGHEFEQTLGDSEGQGSLAYCSPWDRKKSDRTEQLNNNNTMSLRETSFSSCDPLIRSGKWKTEGRRGKAAKRPRTG